MLLGLGPLFCSFLLTFNEREGEGTRERERKKEKGEYMTIVHRRAISFVFDSMSACLPACLSACLSDQKKRIRDTSQHLACRLIRLHFVCLDFIDECDNQPKVALSSVRSLVLLSVDDAWHCWGSMCSFTHISSRRKMRQGKDSLALFFSIVQHLSGLLMSEHDRSWQGWYVSIKRKEHRSISAYICLEIDFRGRERVMQKRRRERERDEFIIRLKIYRDRSKAFLSLSLRVGQMCSIN